MSSLLEVQSLKHIWLGEFLLTQQAHAVFLIDAWLIEEREEVSELGLPIKREVKLTKVDKDEGKLVGDQVLTKHDMFSTCGL